MQKSLSAASFATRGNPVATRPNSPSLGHEGAIRHALDTAYKGNKSSGPSALPSQLVKHLHMGNDESLATMFQAVASIGIPPEWNLTRITPVHKKGPKQDAANYRPVSVMGPLAKLFSSCLNLDLER